MPTQGKVTLKKGQSLQDIVQMLTGAESEMSDRQDAPPRQSYISPEETSMPNFNDVMARSTSTPGASMPYWTPGMHYDPNASKGKKIFQAITSMMGSVDPEYRNQMMKNNQLITMARKNDFNNAIKLYEAEIRKHGLMQQAEEARVRGLNENIKDYNNQLDKLTKRPSSLSMLSKAFELYKYGSNEDDRTVDRTDKIDRNTLKDTNDFIYKKMPTFLRKPDPIATAMAGKPVFTPLDPKNPKDRQQIQEVINSDGFKSAVNMSGADPHNIHQFLAGQYKGLVTTDPDEYFGQKISPSIRNNGKPIARKSADPLRLHDTNLDPTKGEPIAQYLKRLQTTYGGNINAAWAHYLAARFKDAVPNTPDGFKSLVKQQAVSEKITKFGGDPTAVMDEYDNIEEPPEEGTDNEEAQ